MFGKKKNKEQPKEKFAELEINTMPDIFYGGKDPEIYHNREEEGGQPGATAATAIIKNQTPKKIVPLTPSTSQGENKKKKFILWGLAGFLFLSFLGAIIWYYTKDIRAVRSTDQEKTNGRPSSVPVVQSTSTTKEAIPTSTAPETETTSTPETPLSLLGNVDLQFPSVVLADTDDIDSDQLTDKEEELFETDSGGFDTDKDGYFDGQEVFYLYNPKGIAPRRIIDSGLVKEYTNPLTNYRLYYPRTWQAGEVDTLGRQVLFSSIDGDYMEVRAFDKSATETFTDWFARSAKGQKITDLIQFKNRFKVEGWRRRDDLTGYFVDQNKIYVIIFHPAQIGPVSYRHIMKMLMQSFRYAGTTQTLEDQPVINTTVSSTPNSSTSTIPEAITSTSTDTPIVESLATSTEPELF